MQDTIVACATALPAAIAIIRISGEKAGELLQKCFISSEPLKEKLLRYGTITCGELNDKATAVYLKAPRTYTGEDTAEIYIHGSKAIAESLLEFLVKNGARAAQGGEFSKRAYLNGKMDLSSAEGVLAIINAQSKTEARAAYGLLSGSLKQTAQAIQNELKETIALLNAEMDYPEEDLQIESRTQSKQRIETICKKLKGLKESYKSGRLIKNGIRVAVTGGVNVGKSSLVNALLNYERAIVTPLAGTTRDTTEAFFEYKGRRIVIIDTAGIRESKNKIERLGIERARNAVMEADVILAISECGKELNKETKELIKSNENVVYIENKCDLSREKTGNAAIRISALKNVNIEVVKEEIIKFATKELAEGAVLTELRHYNAVERAYSELSSALDLCYKENADCLTAAFISAYNYIGEITGETGSEAIIDEIFSKFCVGK